LNVGPFKAITEYDLARLRNPRVEDDKKRQGRAVRFDYDERQRSLGDSMPRSSAARIVAALARMRYPRRRARQRAKSRAARTRARQ